MIATDWGAAVTEEIEVLKGILNHPGRLAITAALSYGRALSFAELGRLTGLSASNLSQQLRRLEEGGYVEVSKTSRGRRAVTLASITEGGQKAFAAHWDALQSMGEKVSLLDPGEEGCKPETGEGDQ